MDIKKSENAKFMTPSSNAKRLVEKVINGNSNCESSPFRLLPNFSTPPSRLFKIQNPFDSPLRERLHLPMCSPGLFAKSTPKREAKFKWSICDISNLKPADIEPTSVEDNTQHVDPSLESQIQERISSFFSQHSVVPSPLGQDVNSIEINILCNSGQENGSRKSVNHVSTQTNLCFGPKVPQKLEEILKTYENIDYPDKVEDEDVSSCDHQYIPDEVYYKGLFDNESIQSSPPMSTGDSPLQFSPLKELEHCGGVSFSDEIHRRELRECILSPITPEDCEISRRDHSNYSSIRESKSACRLIFTENMSLDQSGNNLVPDIMDQVSNHMISFEETMRSSHHKTADSSGENWDMEYKHVSLASQDYEDVKMDVSLSHTPKTGLFTTQRKRLSDSFKDLQEILADSEGVKILSEIDNPKSKLTSDGSQDMGYHSGSGVSGPSLNENTWNNSHLIASTPTKKKNLGTKVTS